MKEGHTQKWRLLGTWEMGQVMEADRQCQRQEKPEMKDSLLAAAQPFTGSAGPPAATRQMQGRLELGRLTH